MESCWEKGLQAYSVSSSLQRRRSTGIGRSQSQGDGRGCFQEEEESREESCQAKVQTKNRTREFRGHLRGGQTVISDKVLSSDRKDTFKVLYTNARSLIGKIDI